MRNILLSLAFLISTVPVFTQISGKVLDMETSKPLAGAHVIADNEKTTSSNEGLFVLVEPTSQLVVTHLGYLPDTLFTSQANSEIIVKLKPEVQLIEQIIIRGNLNNLPLMQMPSAIGYISLPDKQNLNIISYIENLNRIPGIYAHTGTLNTNRIIIRGIGSRNPYGTNRIKAYYSGIPLTSGDGNTEIEDVSSSFIGSIEVLKGSKSALYGSGLGGVIILNKHPYSKGLHGNAGINIGPYQTLEYGADIKYKAKEFYIGSNYADARTDGWRENSKYWRQNFALNTGFINARTQLDFTLLAINTSAQIPSSLNKQDFENSPQSAAQNWLEVRGFEDYTKFITGIKFSHKFNDKVSNTTNVFFQIYEGYESRPFNILDDEGFSWGARNITSIQLSKTKIQVGFEGLQENYSWEIYETLSGEQGNLEKKYSEKRNPLSVFLNGQYRFSDHALIEAGISLNTLKYSLSNHNDSADQTEDYRYEMVASPFVGFNLQVLPRTRLYGSLSHGFSAPSIEETLLPEGSINPDLKPETGINAEAGLRFESNDQRIFMDACFYRLWARNLLVTKRETEDIFYGANAGKTRHTGFEFSSTLRLNTAESKFPVSLDINYNFIKAIFTEFTDDGIDYSGNTLPGIPQQNLWISLMIESSFGFYLIPQYQFTGKQYLNDANEGSYPAFQLLNFKAGYAIKRRTFNAEFAFGLRNLMDKQYASMILVNAPSFSNNLPRYYYPGNPRNYFVSLKIGF